jgi:DNA-binding transcriptional ArsR family regulator
MIAQPGGAASPAPPVRKMLPIRQKLAALKLLPAGPKATLIEVCELFENGKQDSCWVTNSGLAERLGTHPVTVSRHLLWLCEAGLLDVRHRPELGNRRELTPTLATRAAYVQEDTSAIQELLYRRAASHPKNQPGALSEPLRPSYHPPKTLLAKAQEGLSDTAKSCLRPRTTNRQPSDEVEREPASSPSSSEEKKITSAKVTTLPESQSKSPVPGTEGGAGRAPSVHAEEVQLTDAAHAPLLNVPAVFQAACLDLNPAYAGIDFEHYRLEMRFDSLEKGLQLTPYAWRKRLRHWLANAKSSRNGLLLAAVPGQTKDDPRAVQPLAAKSSASPTKKQSWS